MHTATPAEARVLRSLRAGGRVTLRLQTGRVQQVLRSLIARGRVVVAADGTVSRADTQLDTSCVSMIELTCGGGPAAPLPPEAEMQNPNWTYGVQIDVRRATGEPVGDPALVALILAELFDDPALASQEVEAVMDPEDGVWLVAVPAEVYGEASDEDGLAVTHSGGYVVEIPMP